MFPKIIWIAAAGGLGALSRYGIMIFMQKQLPESDWPVGTMTANLLGCFLFGLIWSLADHEGWGDSGIRIILLTGFIGAFTTFSTYIYETAHYMQRAEYGLALGNFVLQNAAGLLTLALGMSLGSKALPPLLHHLGR
ncbi:fluoride efflux transporter CrcB [Candidatus Sumerlaeota bacterium]|nr:fluoride efflux transporter CrcB [Candidatus Sumerlaeota bacterium]